MTKAADRLTDATNAFSEPFAAALRGYVACLRDAAAKVPALEADNAALVEEALRHVDPCDWHVTDHGTCTETNRAMRCDSCSERESLTRHPGAALLERLAKAESERDTSRRLGAVLGVKLRDVTRALGDEGSETPVALAERAVGERDAAQQEVTAAAIYLDRVAPPNALHSVGVAGVVGEVERLHERVPTLDRELEHVESKRAAHYAAATAAEADRTNLRKQVEDLEQRLSRETAWKDSARLERDAEKARADAAEARVKALETRLKDAAQVELSLRNTLAGSLASQPPPAPAQGDVWTELLASAESMPEPMGHNHDWESGEHEDDCDRCCWEGLQSKATAARATPTPPALVVPDEVRTALAGYLYEAQDLHGPVRELLAPGGRGRLTLATLRQVADILGIKPGVAR